MHTCKCCRCPASSACLRTAVKDHAAAEVKQAALAEKSAAWAGAIEAKWQEKKDAAKAKAAEEAEAAAEAAAKAEAGAAEGEEVGDPDEIAAQ
jgi:hypothetical protein